jgi:multidrug efflux system membrane fusion protein
MRPRLLSAAFLLLAAVVGCAQRKPQVADATEPVVPVSLPVSREVTESVDFTGRTDAVHAVNVVPRVTGYVVKMPFKEGAEVKKGDLLFEIDPRPYKAQLDQANGQVGVYTAQLKLAQATYARDRVIRSRDAGAVTQQQLDQDIAAVEQATAQIKTAEASKEIYALNLEFTKVTSPIDGKVSRHYLSLGNLVNQDQTLLTTVVSLDPMHAYFDMDEPTLLRIRRGVREGTIRRLQAGQNPVLMGLQGEEGFPHKGVINFVNNQLNPATGSISVRGVFPNPLPPRGSRLLSPGMFVRIRLPIGISYKALLVIDRAIGSDQGLKYVYVLDAEDKVQYRRVTTGPLQEDGLRVISEGLKADERVVVGSLQQVRPHAKVKPERIAMPSLAPAAAEKGKQEAKSGGGKS